MEKVITGRDELIQLVYEINRELLMGEAGWRMDKCADMIESYVASREAALVERILDRFGDDDDICGLSIKEIIREAARRKE